MFHFRDIPRLACFFPLKYSFFRSKAWNFTACLFCDMLVVIFQSRLSYSVTFYIWKFKVSNLKKNWNRKSWFSSGFTLNEISILYQKRAFKRAFYSYRTKVHFFLNCQLITPSFNSRTVIARGQIWDKYDFVLQFFYYLSMILFIFSFKPDFFLLPFVSAM